MGNDPRSTPIDASTGRTWRRHALTVAGWLVVGSVITVLIAWGCVLARVFDASPWASEVREERIRPFPVGWPMELGWERPEELDWVAGFGYRKVRGWRTIYQSQAGERLSWDDMSNRSTTANDLTALVSSTGRRFEMTRISAGWPASALESRQATIQHPKTTAPNYVLGEALTHEGSDRASLRQLVDRGILWPEAWTPESNFVGKSSGRIPTTKTLHALPLRPIWLGFLFNAAFWGVVAWSLVRAPRSAIRFTRTRRRRDAGVCVRCRYPLDGLTVCPECGEGAPPAPASVGVLRSRRRDRAMRLAPWIAIGVAVNYAVAWRCMMVSERRAAIRGADWSPDLRPGWNVPATSDWPFAAPTTWPTPAWRGTRRTFGHVRDEAVDFSTVYTLHHWPDELPQPQGFGPRSHDFDGVVSERFAYHHGFDHDLPAAKSPLWTKNPVRIQYDVERTMMRRRSGWPWYSVQTRSASIAWGHITAHELFGKLGFFGPHRLWLIGQDLSHPAWFQWNWRCIYDQGLPIDAIGSERTLDRQQRTLPIRPIWPGFALNMAFYATLAWIAKGGVCLVWRGLARRLTMRNKPAAND